jgi:hypothetical protein
MVGLSSRQSKMANELSRVSRTKEKRRFWYFKKSAMHCVALACPVMQWKSLENNHKLPSARSKFVITAPMSTVLHVCSNCPVPTAFRLFLFGLGVFWVHYMPAVTEVTEFESRQGMYVGMYKVFNWYTQQWLQQIQLPSWFFQRNQRGYNKKVSHD